METLPCSGTRSIPTDERQVAEDLYEGLQAFFRQSPNQQRRPLFITGESYAGKYVPSIGKCCTCILVVVLCAGKDVRCLLFNKRTPCCMCGLAAVQLACSQAAVDASCCM